MFSRLIPYHRRPNWPRFYAQSAQTAQAANVPLLRDFYLAALPDPQAPISAVRFMAIDLETTGLNKQTDEIISIGCVAFDWQSIYLNTAAYSLVKPKRFTQASGSTIHHITHTDLVDAPKLSTVLSRFVPLMAGHVMVAHFRRIERDFLQVASQRCYQNPWRFPIVDTFDIERRLCQQRWQGIPQQGNSRQETQRDQSLRLHQARERYHLPIYQGHHALTDAIASAELLQAQIAHASLENEPIAKYW
ncbi:exonuclease domain-containing protein [Ostreibacterium oceani]|uniref:3'-5' exonuclease n=1 Tax=Ostreibacterium oceani TaxID=2654998 RepID=A0A6N7EZ33_9GAMM|nr:exonuclease domain-containing protein [Ostreibacterium oceani]MPV86427.1 3'-5' exonuclease [Ostreibacterium oceani]